MSGHTARVLRHTVAIGPATPSWRPAARAAWCVAVPLAILFATDHLQWALYAGFGAFTAVYGRNLRFGARLWLQLSAGASLLVAMFLGTAASCFDAPVPLRMLLLALIAGGATWLSGGLGWTPPGPIFAVFATGACMNVPATASSFLALLGVGGGTVLFCLALTLVLSLRRVGWARAVCSDLSWERRDGAIRAVAFVALAVFVSGALAHLLLGGHWYWASLGAIAAVSGPTAHARVARGLQRFAGTAIGVVLAAGLFALEVPPIVLVLVAVVCQGAIEMIVLRNYGLAMCLITVVALAMVQLAAATSDPAELIRDRLWETALGVLVGVVLSVANGALAGRRRAHSA